MVERASALLGGAELVDDLTFSGRALVVRIRRTDGTTAIVKAPARAEALEREAEALRTLPAATRPDLIAAGDGLLVLEDLGTGPSLADLLLGSDGPAAERALLAWAWTLGTALRATARHGRPEPVDDMAPGLAQLAGLAADLGVTPPQGLEDEVSALADALAQPCPWVALCPSDTCPDNNRVLPDGTVRLFDFENAGWRSAASEAAYCRVPFCTCWCVAGLPDGLTGRMEEAFVSAFGLDPADAGPFSEAVDRAASASTLLSFSWFRRFVLDDPPVGPPERAPIRGRQYVYPRLVAMAARPGTTPMLAALAGVLADRVAARWPEAAMMRPYPAFR